MTVTLEDIKRHPYLQAYILQADSNLRAMGYTEHGHRHINLVSPAHNILVRFPERKGDTAIAGTSTYRQCVGRIHHGPAFLIGPILREWACPLMN